MEERKNCYVSAKGNKELFDIFRLFVILDYSLRTVERNQIEKNITDTIENPCFPKSISSQSLTCKDNGTQQNEEYTDELDALEVPVTLKTVVPELSSR